MDTKNTRRRAFVKAAGLAGLAGVTPSSAKAVEPGERSESASPKHPIVHFEIGCRDLAATKDFYQKMFDWPIDEHYQIAEAGLPGHLVSLGHEPEHYTTFYVQVEDVAAAIARAESLGGKKVVGPITIP